jgi:hypothetical protein
MPGERRDDADVLLWASAVIEVRDVPGRDQKFTTRLFAIAAAAICVLTLSAIGPATAAARAADTAATGARTPPADACSGAQEVAAGLNSGSGPFGAAILAMSCTSSGNCSAGGSYDDSSGNSAS